MFTKNNPFCDDFRPLIPSDTYRSSNYALVGCANPKTYVPPILGIRSHDLSEWAATNLVTMSGINDQTNFDYYRSGYAPNRVPANNVTVKGLNSKNYQYFDDGKKKCGDQMERVTTQYVGPDAYQQTRLDEPIHNNIGISLTKQFDPMIVSRDDISGTVTYMAVDGNYPLNTYCGKEEWNGGGGRHRRGGLLYNDDGRERTHVPVETPVVNFDESDLGSVLKLIRNNARVGSNSQKSATPTIQSTVANSGGVRLSGDDRYDDRYDDRSVINILDSDKLSTNWEIAGNGNDSGNQTFKGCGCDDRDPKEDVSHWPALNFDGNSVNPNWIYAKDKLVDYNDVYELDSKDRYTTLNKLLKKSSKYRPTETNPSIYNTFDPRFTGYGDATRYNVNEMTGAPTFDYDDIDSITREKLISRSSVDIYPWAMSSNPNDSTMCGSCDSDDYGQKAVDAYTNATLKFRTELQERVMRKRNAELWQRRVAPIYRNY